jgi:Fe-S cluster assembly scaffold protein SufB
MRACQNGNVVVTQVLVAAKANVDVQRAVSSSLVLMTFASMKYGCAAIYQDGCTALILACREGHTAVVQLLVAAGADVNKLHRVSGCIGP